MQGLTWQGFKAYVDGVTGGNALSGTFHIDAAKMEVKARVYFAEGNARPFTVPVDADNVTGLRLLVRRFYEEKKPDEVHGAILEIDWAKGEAIAFILYKKNGVNTKYNERHTF